MPAGSSQSAESRRGPGSDWPWGSPRPGAGRTGAFRGELAGGSSEEAWRVWLLRIHPRRPSKQLRQPGGGPGRVEGGRLSTLGWY